jgi:hypothetical protein
LVVGVPPPQPLMINIVTIAATNNKIRILISFGLRPRCATLGSHENL